MPREALIGDRIRQEKADVAVQELKHRFAYPLFAVPYVVGVAARCRPFRVEAAAEVTDRGRAVVDRPVLRPQRLRHRRPGIEWGSVRTGRHAGMWPTEFFVVRSQPDLERLRGHRTDMRG